MWRTRYPDKKQKKLYEDARNAKFQCRNYADFYEERHDGEGNYMSHYLQVVNLLLQIKREAWRQKGQRRAPTGSVSSPSRLAQKK
mmetsp:Transcript_22970/g.39421  ORF Transcript_22970/g.39421 Transcript_22970/m.39421 type:complete len:85 (+) Transcript_22970:549-803(+)